jgi:hypothetical protein
LTIGAVLLCPAGASAGRVHRAEEFGIGGVAHDLAAGPDGNMWFTSGPAGRLFGAGSVGRITPQGKIAEFSKGLNRHNSPGSIVVGQAGPVPAIGRITPRGAITVFDQCASALTGPLSLSVGPDGNVWFGGAAEGAVPGAGHHATIGRVTPDGRITKFSAGLRPDSETASIVAGPDRALWFIDREYEAVGRIGVRATPANGFVPLAAKRASRSGAATLPVAVPSAGTLRFEPLAVVGRHGPIPLRRRKSSGAESTGCERAMLRIGPNAAVGARLRRFGAVRLRARIRFRPRGGLPRRRTVAVVLSRRRSG